MTVWLVSLHGRSIDFFGVIGVLRLLSPFPVAGVALYFAWRASRELSLDLGSRKFWRLLITVLVLVMVTPWLRFMPILFLTTESQQSKRAEAKAAGASGWIVKPATADTLLNTIKLVLR